MYSVVPLSFLSQCHAIMIHAVILRTFQIFSLVVICEYFLALCYLIDWVKLQLNCSCYLMILAPSNQVGTVSFLLKADCAFVQFCALGRSRNEDI